MTDFFLYFPWKRGLHRYLVNDKKRNYLYILCNGDSLLCLAILYASALEDNQFQT
jgi:hypothetical protein